MHKRFVNRFTKQLMSDAFSQIYAKIGRVSAVWYIWVELGWIIIRIQHVLQYSSVRSVFERVKDTIAIIFITDPITRCGV